MAHGRHHGLSFQPTLHYYSYFHLQPRRERVRQTWILPQVGLIDYVNLLAVTWTQRIAGEEEPQAGVQPKQMP